MRNSRSYTFLPSISASMLNRLPAVLTADADCMDVYHVNFSQLFSRSDWYVFSASPHCDAGVFARTIEGPYGAGVVWFMNSWFNGADWNMAVFMLSMFVR